MKSLFLTMLVILTISTANAGVGGTKADCTAGVQSGRGVSESTAAVFTESEQAAADAAKAKAKGGKGK